MCWVIYGHNYAWLAYQANNILSLFDEIVKPGMITLVPSAYFAVDVFFFMGGLLAAALGVNKIAKMNKINPWIIP